MSRSKHTRDMQYSARRALLVVCGLLCVSACASNPRNPARTLHAEPSATRPSTATPAALASHGGSGKSVDPSDPALRQLFAATEHARGLRFKHAVPVVIQTADQIAAYLAEELDAQKLSRTQSLYEVIGLLEPGTDIRKMVQRVLEEQVVGYYDTTRAQLVIRDDTEPPSSVSAKSTAGNSDDPRWREMEKNFILVHELTHALQDQHLKLGEQAEVDRDTDADNAFRALVEGDATLAMLGYLAHQMGRSLDELVEFPSLIEQTVHTSSGVQAQALSSAPAILRETLLSSYTDGLLFCVALYRAGGWNRVNAAHAGAPSSTRDILHPNRYLSEVPSQQTHRHDANLVNLGTHTADEAPLAQDTLGQLEMRIFFELGNAKPVAKRAAEGWSHDRLTVYPSDRFVWRATWDTVTDAIEAERAVKRSLVVLNKKRPGSRTFVVRSNQTVLWGKNVPEPARSALQNAL